MELLPKPQTPDDLTLEEKYPGLNQMLSDFANKTRALNPRRPSYKQHAIRAFTEAFEAVGGVSRLAIWGDENYSEFIKLFSRMAPVQAQHMLAGVNDKPKIISAIPPSPLDGDYEEGEYTEHPPLKEARNDHP